MLSLFSEAGDRLRKKMGTRVGDYPDSVAPKVLGLEGGGGRAKELTRSGFRHRAITPTANAGFGKAGFGKTCEKSAVDWI